MTDRKDLIARKKQDTKRPIESYEHRDEERVNNPPVGLGDAGDRPRRGREKEDLRLWHLDPLRAGKVQMIDVAPPYGIRYGSRYQSHEQDC